MSKNNKNKRRDELKKVSGGYDVVNFVPRTFTSTYDNGITYVETTMHNRIAPHLVVDLGTASSGLKVGGNATFIDSSVRHTQNSAEGTVTKTTTYK